MAPFERQVLRHDQNHAISHQRRAHRERDSGIAAGRLDERVAGLDIAALLRPLDHGERRPVLYRARGIVAFELGEQRVAGALPDPLESDQRRVADELLECP
ncbi:hypothetical protein D3C83_50430 [compost metagenome]